MVNNKQDKRLIVTIQGNDYFANNIVALMLSEILDKGVQHSNYLDWHKKYINLKETKDNVINLWDSLKDIAEVLTGLNREIFDDYPSMYCKYWIYGTKHIIDENYIKENIVPKGLTPANTNLYTIINPTETTFNNCLKEAYKKETMPVIKIIDYLMYLNEYFIKRFYDEDYLLRKLINKMKETKYEFYIIPDIKFYYELKAINGTKLSYIYQNFKVFNIFVGEDDEYVRENDKNCIGLFDYYLPVKESTISYKTWIEVLKCIQHILF